MTDRTRVSLSAVVAALLLALAACSSGGAAKPDSAAGPPAGGWPQPENGRLTGKMCKLLTPADYKRFHHTGLLALEARSNGAVASSNAMYCSAPPADILAFSLQPTAEAAKLYYERELRQRKRDVEQAPGKFLDAMIQL